MSDQKAMTGYEFTFIAIRLISLCFVPQLLTMISGFLSLVARIDNPVDPVILISLVSFTVMFVLLILFMWFGAAGLARRLCPKPANKLPDDAELPNADLTAWQNLGLTLLGFYLLYLALSILITLISSMAQGVPPQDRLDYALLFVLRFGAAMLLIIAPQELTHGVKWLRSNISKVRGF